MVTYEMLTTSAAARRAGVSEQTIRSWMRRGLLAAEQTPLGALLDAADVDAAIAERERRQRERVRTRQVKVAT